MTLANIQRDLLASYQTGRGINHIDGHNLPSERSVNKLASNLMRLLFPGFFEEQAVAREDLAACAQRLLSEVAQSLRGDIEKTLAFTKSPDAPARAETLTLDFLSRLPAIREIVQTDVEAAYEGDPAARSLEEIILAYPCVLVISLQRLAHVLHTLGVPILPRMITEYAHEKTGADIHPGAQIGTHFFLDHCTGIVVGETATIGNHVKIYQGVTLGAKSFDLDADGNPVKGVKRHPDIGDHVTIYSHATILGGQTRIGANSIIGANVWLLTSVPDGSVVHYKGESLVVRSRRKREQSLGSSDADDPWDDWMI
jgi:serine O-acetyltransferase